MQVKTLRLDESQTFCLVESSLAKLEKNLKKNEDGKPYEGDLEVSVTWCAPQTSGTESYS